MVLLHSGLYNNTSIQNKLCVILVAGFVISKSVYSDFIDYTTSTIPSSGLNMTMEANAALFLVKTGKSYQWIVCYSKKCRIKLREWNEMWLNAYIQRKLTKSNNIYSNVIFTWNSCEYWIAWSIYNVNNMIYMLRLNSKHHFMHSKNEGQLQFTFQFFCVS